MGAKKLFLWLSLAVLVHCTAYVLLFRDPVCGMRVTLLHHIVVQSRMTSSCHIIRIQFTFGCVLAVVMWTLSGKFCATIRFWHSVFVLFLELSKKFNLHDAFLRFNVRDVSWFVKLSRYKEFLSNPYFASNPFPKGSSSCFLQLISCSRRFAEG